MALARTYAMALAGMRGHVVEVEADIENGLVALLRVGLPDTALRGPGTGDSEGSRRRRPG
ncbi:MAG TPA: hypothetical protein VGI66_19150 [Streptosporangiaceae bacterium]